MKLSRVLRISRPRFWIYELGPYMIGVLAAIYATIHYWIFFDSIPTASELFTRDIFFIFLFALYFLIPANIWIYWINDIYDYETDKLNPKKLEWYEALVAPKEQKSLWKWILWTTLPFCIFLPWPIPWLHGALLWVPTIIAFLAFLFFSWQYSAKPIRAKAIPILDSFFSAWHYIATAVFWYLLVNPTWDINRYYVIAGMARAMAMHAFSAVPDIQADKDAKLATIATFLWWKATIRACFGLYLLASLLSYSFLWRVSIVLGVVYCWLMIWAATLYGDEKKLFALYKRFPWINTVSGMVLFFVVLLKIL
jgi:lycopene elongase/hydratase (dihydrobisanhydrobacterioruberin-forming)